MRTASSETLPPPSAPRFPGWVSWPAALAFIAVGVIYAFSTCFSYFAYYDDEGFLMISIRGFLEGQPLYDGVLTFYGPFYYCYEWLIHTALSLPLTHDVTRFVCVVHWLAASAVLGVVGWRLTRSRMVALFTFMQGVAHLTPLAREPGHPQEVVALLLVLAVLAAAKGFKPTWTPTALGAIAAALLFTKINVGAFFGFGLALAFVCQLQALRLRRIFTFGLMSLSALLPIVLMGPSLNDRWARGYCAAECAAILAAGLVATSLDRSRQFKLSELSTAGLVLAGCALPLVLILILTGSSLPAALKNLVTGPAGLRNEYYVPLQTPGSVWSAVAALGAAVAAAVLRERLDRVRLGIGLTKLLYACIGSFLFVNDCNKQLGYLLPWAWLILIGPWNDPQFKPHKIFPRILLCLLAVWQGLGAYPTAGTQAVIATLPLTLLFSMCAYDALKEFAGQVSVAHYLQSVPPRTARLFGGMTVASSLYLFTVYWCPALPSWRYYWSVPALNLPGAHYLRLPEDEASQYRLLAQYVEAQSDTFITIPGFNSLYFWTTKSPPTYFNLSEVMLLDESQQLRVVSELQRTRRSLIVLNAARTPLYRDTDPLYRLLREDFHEVKKIGNFWILAINRPQLHESQRRSSADAGAAGL